MKKFIKKLMVFIIPFLIVFFIFLFVIKNISGDIGALAYIPFGKYEVPCNIPETNKVIDCYNVCELKDAEIITIGDSFNRFGGNCTFSNYIGNELNHDVYRAQLTLEDYSLFDSLINTASFPSCKVLILESVERRFVSRLNYYGKDKLHFSKFNDARDWKSYITLNDFFSFMRVRVNYNNPISSLKLDGQYFSCDFCTDKLFFLNQNSSGGSDLFFKYTTKEECEKAIENLQRIRTNVESKGIKMIFVVAADKYDMYYDYTIDNKYGQNHTLEYFSQVDSTFFVNSKSILKPYIDKGVKDVYLANDTHWSPIAAEIIGKHIANIIESEGYLND